MATPNYLWKIKDKGNVVLSPDNLPTLTTGTTNGTISWNGTDITVYNDANKANGASSSTDDAIVRFDGTDGKTLQNSTVTISDDGAVYIPETGSLGIGALSLFYNNSNDTYVIGTPGAAESLMLNVNGKGQIRIKDGNIEFISCDALSSSDYGYAYSKLPINDGSTSSNYYTIATREYISDVISGLDGTVSGTAGASKTLSALSETDGKISATFTDIKITESQVTNLTTDLAAKALKTTKINGHALSGDVTVTASDVGVSATTSSVTVGSTTFNKYTHPTGSAASKSSGLYKFSTDSTSHISGVTAVTKDDITALGIPSSDTNQTIKSGTTTFGVNAAVDIVGGTNITVTPDTTNNKLTITNNYSYTNPWYLITTAGQEAVSDGSNKLNVVTRDTTQTITGAKTFTNILAQNQIAIGSSDNFSKIIYDTSSNILEVASDLWIDGSLIPNHPDGTYNLGSSSYGWNNIYFTPPSDGDSMLWYDNSTFISIPTLISLPSTISNETTARQNADATLQTNINAKQDKLTAGDNVTINGSTISVDLSAYAKTSSLGSYVLKAGDTMTGTLAAPQISYTSSNTVKAYVKYNESTESLDTIFA